MKLEVMVKADGFHFYGGAAVEIAEPLAYAFEPIRTGDYPELMMATGELPPNSVACERKLTLRKEAAKEIALALTELLMNEMSKKDEHNGYNRGEL